MRKRDLTPQAKRALAVHAELVEELGYLPTVREFAKAYGVKSSSGAHSILKQLRAHGHEVPTRGRRGGAKCE